MNSSTATGSAGSGGAAGAAAGQSWLTAVLRPAGSLDQAAVHQLGAALGHLAAATDMVVVDLSAAAVRDPRAFARALGEPAAEFERAGGCLLVIGAPRALTAELAHAAAPVVTLADDVVPVTVPAQAAAHPTAHTIAHPTAHAVTPAAA
jgi:hypothetical protein